MIRSSERQWVSSGELFLDDSRSQVSHRDDGVGIQAILLSPIASNAAAKRDAAVRMWFHVVQPVR